MDEWYVWTINQQRYKRVEEFLKNIPEIKECLYLTVVKEYDTKTGKKSKNVPLYNNYIFVRYNHTDELHTRICTCPWIYQCLGKCSKKEITEIYALSKKKYSDIATTNELKKGCIYKLKGTPFKDMSCTLVEIDKDRLVVSVELFGSDRLIKCSMSDIYLGE